MGEDGESVEWFAPGVVGVEGSGLGGAGGMGWWGRWVRGSGISIKFMGYYGGVYVAICDTLPPPLLLELTDDAVERMECNVAKRASRQ